MTRNRGNEPPRSWDALHNHREGRAPRHFQAATTTIRVLENAAYLDAEGASVQFRRRSIDVALNQHGFLHLHCYLYTPYERCGSEELGTKLIGFVTLGSPVTL